MSLDPNSFLCDDFKVSCVEIDLGYNIFIPCKNESCVSFYKHTNTGMCLLCYGECKGHRTQRAFHFGQKPDSPESIKAMAEIAAYQCKNCGGKEFLTPLDAPSKEE